MLDIGSSLLIVIVATLLIATLAAAVVGVRSRRRAQRIEADRHITTIAEIRETVQRTAAGDICLGLLLLIPTATANSST